MKIEHGQTNEAAGARAGRCAILLLGLAALSLGGCVVSETRPLPKVHPIQPTKAIPQTELLDVGVRVFDPGVPEGEVSEALQQKERLYPDVRRAEARFFATKLRDTLEGSGQWGAVRVIPAMAEFVDVIVSGRILRSDGKYLDLEISVEDSTGRTWLKKKRYDAPADIGSYMSDAALRQRDPFQNIYSLIANDMVAARQALMSADLREIRRVTELRFAQDLAPEAFGGYLAHEPKGGRFEVARLPAENDPIFERVHRIRERDGALIDTVSDQYDNFSEQVSEPYGSWRRYSYDEIDKEEKLKGQARTRMIMGAAAIIGGLLASSQCPPGDYRCQSIEQGLRYSAYAGGLAGILSGLKKRANAKIHTAAIQELASSFNAEVAPRVMEVEGRTLKLTGTAEDQYREWREMLRDLYNQETGAGQAPDPAATAPAAPSPPPASTSPSSAASTTKPPSSF